MARVKSTTTVDSLESPLLNAIGPAERTALVRRLRPRSYKPGQVVFNQGDPGDCLHLVRSGRFDVQMITSAGHTMTLRVVHPGELFGELALVQPEYRRAARVCALEQSETSAIYRQDFDELRLQHPSVDRFLVAALAERVLRTSELASEMLLPPETRLWRRLAVFAEAYGDEPIRMSQDVLAHAAGTVRQTANRVLRSGVELGILALDRGAIRVLDRTGLERLANQ